ncbi:MAG TPA: metallophosphoesterase [Vicinamibacterales bacterium]|nr:metallophosphoesterase [Vicinamibacterales bacterium]
MLTFAGAALITSIVTLFVVAPWRSEPPVLQRSAPSVVTVPLPPSTDATALALPEIPGSLRFAVMGDTGRGDAVQYDTAAQMAKWRERFDFTFVLMLGDNNYGTGSHDDYVRRFERPYKPLFDAGVEFHAVIGNHDPPDQWHYAPFNMHGHRFYTFEKEYGVLKPVTSHQVRFFALDSVTMDREELAWLEQNLSQSNADWKIAFYHHPLYTSGRYARAAARLRARLEPIFVKGGLDVGFSGHEHFYERIVPKHGVQYFTSGAGGALRVGDIRRTDLTAAGFDQDTHFMLIEIAGDTLYFQVISRTGQTVDAGRLVHERAK